MDTLVQRARREAIDQWVASLAAENLTESAQVCMTDYINGLTDEDIASFLLQDGGATGSFRANITTCSGGQGAGS